MSFNLLKYDDQEVINMLKGISMHFSSTEVIIKDVKSIALKFHPSFAPRCCNRVAHRLSLIPNYISTNEPSTCVYKGMIDNIKGI